MDRFNLRVYSVCELTGLEHDFILATSNSKLNLVTKAKAFMGDPNLDFIRLPDSLKGEDRAVWFVQDSNEFAVIKKRAE